MRRLCLTCVLMLALVSCSESTGPIRDLDALQISVRAEPETIVAGSAVSVVLTLRNTLLRRVEVSACPIYFWVAGGNGQIVGGSNGILCFAFAGTFVYQPLLFAPFETKTMTFQWLASETQSVPAGVYDVFGWVNDSAHVSPPARITVLPAN